MAHTLKIARDPDPESPRAFCNVGKMVSWHHYKTLGDGRVQSPRTQHEWIETLADAAGLRSVLDAYRTAAVDAAEAADPDATADTLEQAEADATIRWFDENNDKLFFYEDVYCYEHSSITVRCEPFACPWDSGKVGIIVCSAPFAIRELGTSDPEKVSAALKGEVSLFDTYLQGDVWGFVVQDENGEEVDSCWGFYGEDKESIRQHLADPAVAAQLDAAWEARYEQA